MNVHGVDEMHRYVGNKKTIVGSGLLLIDLGSTSSTLSWHPRNWGRKEAQEESLENIEWVATDYWKAY
jgi:hypothetical protein